MTRPSLARLAPVSLLALAMAPALAEAGSSHTCEQAETDEWTVDGMLDDWTDVRKTRVGGTARDASYDLRCVYDDATLVVSVDVRDERIVRTAAAKATGEDHLSLALSAGGAKLELTLFPASDRVQPKRKWGSSALPSWISVEDTLQEKGFSMEIAVPLAKIAGWSKSSPSLAADVGFHDADLASENKIQTISSFTGDLAFAGTATLLDSFFAATGLTATQLTLDATVQIDGKPGLDRVVAGGKVLGLLGERFSYIELPVTSAADVQSVKVVDLRGDGVSSVIAVVRQRTAGTGGSGTTSSRDLLIVYGVSNDTYCPTVQIEIRKQLGARILTSTWSLVRRGQYRPLAKGQKTGTGNDLLVVAKDPVGWDEDSFRETPATDAVPILQPWDDDRHAEVHWLESGAAKRKAIEYDGA